MSGVKKVPLFAELRALKQHILQLEVEAAARSVAGKGVVECMVFGRAIRLAV